MKPRMLSLILALALLLPVLAGCFGGNGPAAESETTPEPAPPAEIETEPQPEILPETDPVPPTETETDPVPPVEPEPADDGYDPAAGAEISASSVDELSNLGLEEWDGRLGYLRALVTGDVDALEAVSGVEAGMYAAYRTLELSRWVAWLADDTGSGVDTLHFAFLPAHSDVEAFPAGVWCEGRIYEGLLGAYFTRPETASFGEAADALYEMLSRYILLELPTTDEMEDYTRSSLTCYIYHQLPEADRHDGQRYKDYARVHFGIGDFTPEAYHVEYGCAHGGSHQVLSVIGSEERGSETLVTVQLYADLSKTVKSHTYRYTMHRTDDGWAYVGYEEIEHAPYDWACWTM